MQETVDLEAETRLDDLEIVERRVDRLTSDRSNPRELEALKKLFAHLENEKPIRSFELAPEEEKMLAGYRFLSQKPLLLVMNLAEDAIGSDLSSGS